MRVTRLIPVVALSLLIAACAGNSTGEDDPSTTSTTAPAPTTTTTEATTTTIAATTTTAGHGDHGDPGAEADPADIAAANLATAAFQDVALAEAAGYGSTMDALGCFENADSGGMGLHYLNESLMDDVVDVTAPEALVYELDANGEIAGLVAHEYIVPLEAWTEDEPPSLFGRDFHEHGVLPLWVMHAWIWKDNPAGTFVDYNPAVRQCPDGVPIFGVDLP
jgi:hypothetical protein